MPAAAKSRPIVISALKARTGFGRLLDRIDSERRSLIIEKRGAPRAVLLTIRDYVRLAAPEPDILRIVGEEAQRSGASRLTARQIDAVIRSARAARRTRKTKSA